MNCRTLARRALLGATVLAIPAMLLGCDSVMTAQTVTSQSVADVDLIANALESVLPALQIVTGLDLAAVNTVTNDVKAIVATATGFVATVSEATGRTIVQQIISDFSALTQALSTIPMPPQVETVLFAVQVLLPIIELSVGLAVSGLANAPGMTPEAARAVLHAATLQ